MTLCLIFVKLSLFQGLNFIASIFDEALVLGTERCAGTSVKLEPGVFSGSLAIASENNFEAM
jgi:hypothetical protein